MPSLQVVEQDIQLRNGEEKSHLAFSTNNKVCANAKINKGDVSLAPLGTVVELDAEKEAKAENSKKELVVAQPEKGSGDKYQVIPCKADFKKESGYLAAFHLAKHAAEGEAGDIEIYKRKTNGWQAPMMRNKRQLNKGEELLLDGHPKEASKPAKRKK